MHKTIKYRKNIMWLFVVGGSNAIPLLNNIINPLFSPFREYTRTRTVLEKCIQAIIMNPLSSFPSSAEMTMISKWEYTTYYTFIYVHAFMHCKLIRVIHYTCRRSRHINRIIRTYPHSRGILLNVFCLSQGTKYEMS